MEVSMPRYRVYFTDYTGRSSRPPKIIDCVDDQDATKKARQFIDGYDVEVWNQERIIVNYPHE